MTQKNLGSAYQVVQCREVWGRRRKTARSRGRRNNNQDPKYALHGRKEKVPSTASRFTINILAQPTSNNVYFYMQYIFPVFEILMISNSRF